MFIDYWLFPSLRDFTKHQVSWRNSFLVHPPHCCPIPTHPPYPPLSSRPTATFPEAICWKSICKTWATVMKSGKRSWTLIWKRGRDGEDFNLPSVRVASIECILRTSQNGVALTQIVFFSFVGKREHSTTKQNKICDLLCSCKLVNNKLFIYQTNLLKPWVHGNCFTWPSGRSLSHFGIRMSRCRPLVTYHDLEEPTSQGGWPFCPFRCSMWLRFQLIQMNRNKKKLRNKTC